MINIQEKSKCCGCSACKNICPKDCISMISDNEGFLYPQVDTSKCVDCHLCEKVCPVLNSNHKLDERIAYACYNNDETIRLQSSSGGIFTLLAETIISQDGIVFGASFDKNFNVVHTQVDNIEDLSKLRGSKYVQSDINTTYKQAKDYLNQGRQVLFSGTPCQINGFSNYLKKSYDNLLLVDFICHGVPSPLVWNNYVKDKERDYHATPQKISFRHKNYGWKRFSVSFLFKNDTEYLKDLHEDKFMKGFLSDLYLRPSCYKCESHGENRASDITLADFWGIQNVLPQLDDDKGTSLVVVNTSKGRSIFESLQSKMICQSIELNKAISYNPSYYKSVEPNKNREKFFNELNSTPFDVLINKYGNKKRPLIRRILSKIKKILKKFI
ncbi:MAG: Coenzyme F420 hydrogenase/dehydrogenase, beta subunit C-terminal domain [Oscillospiraceae bacterium]